MKKRLRKKRQAKRLANVVLMNQAIDNAVKNISEKELWDIIKFQKKRIVELEAKIC